MMMSNVVLFHCIPHVTFRISNFPGKLGRHVELCHPPHLWKQTEMPPLCSFTLHYTNMPI